MENKKENIVKDSIGVNPPSVFDDFEGWFLGIIDEIQPSMVVSIARGAARFLQLFLSSENYKKIRHVSHHAIPFLPQEDITNKRILIFDDSVIYGSTMDEVKRILERRGAMTFCVSYAVDRENFLGEARIGSISNGPSRYSHLPIRAKHKLWSNDIRRHHATLVSTILNTSLHYNLDFPTFSITFEECSNQDSSYILHLLQQISSFSRVADVSSTISLECGIPRYSAILRNKQWNSCITESIIYRPYGKIRITFAPENKQLLLTPIMQMAIPDNVKYEDIHFGIREADGLWNKLNHPQEDGEKDQYHSSLFRLLTAFEGIILGNLISQEVISKLHTAFKIHSLSLRTDDMGLILGEKNAILLSDFWSNIKNGNIKASLPVQTIVNNRELTLQEDSILKARIVDLFKRSPHFLPASNDLICESIGKLFLALWLVTDSPKCRQENPCSDRLKTGLTYETIRSLLCNTRGVFPEEEEISLAIDYCVDEGLAVPKIIEKNGYWHRAFYCGEDRDNQSLLQFKMALYETYRIFLEEDKTKLLTSFDFQKLCVSLKDVAKWLPISTSPYKYGYTATVGQEQLINWLTEGLSAPFEKCHRGNRNVIIPKEGHPFAANSTLTAQVKREFSDAFNYTATAFCKLSDKAKLLLTTCRTHRHTFNAIAFEARSWGTDKSDGLGAALLGLSSDLTGKKIANAEILYSLYWSIRYIAEAGKKYDIFSTNYPSIIKELEQAFVSQGIGGQNWWEYLKGLNLFNSNIDIPVKRKLEYLLPLLKQMKNLTAFLVKMLFEFKVISSEDLEKEFNENGTSLRFEEFKWLDCNMSEVAREYNLEIDKGNLPGKSIITDKLPVIALNQEANEGVIDSAIQTTKTCFDQICDALRLFCPKYEADDNTFPYLPNQEHRVLENGDVEEDRNNTYILTLDIIKGTYSSQTNSMKEQIRTVLHDFASKGCLYEDTGNDCYVVCAEDPRILWDIAKIIQSRGEDLKKPGDPFKGTRKGLSFGDIVIVKKQNGEILLHDFTKLNVIPAACYLLQGADKSVAEDERNSVLIIEFKTLERCFERLGINISSLQPETMTAKHFIAGKYYVIQLS